ncbi:MAG: methyltransferase [Bradymonadia bacterium]
MFLTKIDLESTVRSSNESFDCDESVYQPSFSHELRVKSLVGLMSLGSRIKSARLCGLRLEIDPGVCNPAPLPGLSFSKLFSAGISDIKPHHLVLDMGTGCGVWALLAARKGATVTASDLLKNTSDRVQKNADLNQVSCPETVVGDLFDGLLGRKFDKILFNPPFHFGAPQSSAEAAYLGGEGGEVVKRFLNDAVDHLLPNGSIRLILPAIELDLYRGAMHGYDVRCRFRQWVPVLGDVFLLELKPK